MTNPTKPKKIEQESDAESFYRKVFNIPKQVASPSSNRYKGKIIFMDN
jgi:hypothetical protein